MKIAFTGASSFSGMWFIKALVHAGHEVTPIFRFSYDDYMGVRRQRVDQVLSLCRPVFQAPFGGEAFIKAISSCSGYDLLCHHGADVTNYKSPDFNPVSALASNTHNIHSVLLILKEGGCQRVLLTGSVFEQNEGMGSDNLRAVSPYGLSKGLTADMFSFYTDKLQLKLGKFVIPNPFGAFEEGRFTTYLAKQWLSKEIPVINTPSYVRDNIPISLLAEAYAAFAMHLSADPGFEKYNPSFFAESQELFTERFAVAMRSRLDVDCLYKLKQQSDFDEPLVRVNTHPIDAAAFTWKEPLFWDELAAYYISLCE